MNLTGDLVRRAAANVSSTVSSVASVASGRKRHDSTGNGRNSSVDDTSFYNAKEKYSLTLKVLNKYQIGFHAFYFFRLNDSVHSK